MLGSRSDCILDFYPVMIYLAHKFMIMNTLFPFLSRTHAQMEGVCFYSWTFYTDIESELTVASRKGQLGSLGRARTRCYT